VLDAIVVESLTKVYEHKKTKVTALEKISFRLGTKRLLSVLGPNGAGKTTLIRILTTQLKPTSGDAWVLGYHVVKEPWPIRWRVAVVPQEAGVYNMITPWEFVYYYSRVRGLSSASARESARQSLEMLDLWDYRHTPAYRLSGGQKRRMIIAAALASNPEILFLDEPTVGLDPLARRGLWSKIRNLVKEGRTIVLTTHYMDEAEILSDEIIVVNKGLILARGKIEELKKSLP
jgi:ABC-2 type transport system ATP-binding protein